MVCVCLHPSNANCADAWSPIHPLVSPTQTIRGMTSWNRHFSAGNTFLAREIRS
jgi:hypothetical protein